MGRSVDSSVIVPGFGNAATGAGGEAGVLTGSGVHSLAGVGWGVEHGRLNRVDSVAVAIDVVHKVNGVAERIFHHVNGDGLDAVGESETEVTHGVLCFDSFNIQRIGREVKGFVPVVQLAPRPRRGSCPAAIN